MNARVAVLCWEESRPWVSALRQQGFSVPWVEEPKGEVHRQIPSVEPDVLIVDMTRLPERGKGMVSDLADEGALDGVPVVLVGQKNNRHGLKGKVASVVVSSPDDIISAVNSVLRPQ